MFDWAMENMSIWASLDIESRNAKTLGRAYTCGVSNMGRYPFDTQVLCVSLLATCHAVACCCCCCCCCTHLRTFLVVLSSCVLTLATNLFTFS